MEDSMTLSLQDIEEGIEALKAVEEYLNRIRADRNLSWTGWDEVLATAVDVMLQRSTEQHTRLEKILVPDNT
jgi:hypothetical protein